MPQAPPELIDALRRALRRHGPQAVTMERIASEAGLSRVTLHRRGITKAQLLAQLVEEATDRYRQALWPALVSEAPASARLEQALSALCEVAEQELELLLALRNESDAVFHEVSDGEVLTRSVFTEPLERILRDAAAAGDLAEGDPVERATLLFNLVGWTYVHLRTGHRWEPEHARDATVAVALRGVLRSG